MSVRDVARLAGALALAGCSIGPGGYRQAEKPGGATVQVEWTGGAGVASFGGELLHADEEGLVVLLPGAHRVVRVPYAEIRHAEVLQFDDLDLQRGRAPSAPALARLRRLARFPQGLTPEVEAALLEAYGRESIESP